MPELYIGVMSGSSADAVDTALVSIRRNASSLIAHHNTSFPQALRKDVLALNEPGSKELERMCSLDVQLGHFFADSVRQLLDKVEYSAANIRAIGSHGHTVRHYPDSEFPSTLQIGDPNIIAESTGITTIADFRRRNMAVGGQGAPLVPVLHSALFRHNRHNRVIVNIGGIANITILPANASLPVTGFDTGPGNCLMDVWINQHQGINMDSNGSWAASGKVNQELLERLLKDPFFSQSPPKSTGRDYFNLKWLQKKLRQYKKRVVRKNVQSTLCELTAASIASAINEYAPVTDEVLVCGGGVHNMALMFRLQQLLGNRNLRSTDDYGIDPDWIEAMTFAWLAKQTMDGAPVKLSSVTGAKKDVILGAIYPGLRS